MAGAKKKEISKTLPVYLESIRNGVEYKDIAKGVYVSEHEIIKIFTGRKNPSYAILTSILEYFGIGKEKIEELANKDSILLYEYWSNLYPQEASIKDLNNVVREEMYKKNITSRDMVKAFKVAQSYVSAVLSGIYPVSYNNLVTIAPALGETPLSILNKLKGRQEIMKARIEFSDILKNQRASKNITIDNASMLCQLSRTNYTNIEKGDKKIEPKTLEKICKGLKLDIEKIGEVAIAGKIVLNEKELRELYSNKRTRYVSKEEVLLENEIFELAKYEKITLYSMSYNADTIIVLLLMILCSELKTKEKGKNEILYYLNCLKNSKDEEIYKDLRCLEVPTENGEPENILQAFTYYRESFNWSFMQLSKVTGYSKSYLSNRTKDLKNPLSLKFVEKVFPIINMPMSYNITLMIRQRGIEKCKKSIRVSEIIERFKEYPIISFWGEAISYRTIEDIFKILFDNSKDAPDKYLALKKLPLPIEYTNSPLY